MSNARVNLFRGLSNALFYYMDEEKGSTRRTDVEIAEIIKMNTNPIINVLMRIAAVDWAVCNPEEKYDALMAEFVETLESAKAPFTWKSRYAPHFLRRFGDIRTLHSHSKAHKFMSYPINHLMALKSEEHYDFFKIYRGFVVFIYNAFPNSEAHMIFNIINNICVYSFTKRSTPQQKEELVRFLKLLA